MRQTQRQELRRKIKELSSLRYPKAKRVEFKDSSKTYLPNGKRETERRMRDMN